ncbi:MAG: hypothetical protein AAGE52_18745 [Myxococcota bacterium]
MNRLQELLGSGGVDIAAVAAYLDELDSGRRRREVLTLERSHQRRLFDAAQGWQEMTLDDLTPEAHGTMSEVPHHGRNTLPAFRYFAKVFTRPSEGEGELWGYNRNDPLIENVVGPGYFVTHQHHEPGELLVNYLRLPPRGLPSWPPVISNAARLSRFVYNGTQDVLRKVSTHVTIGRAQKSGRWMPAWFVLVRD